MCLYGPLLNEQPAWPVAKVVLERYNVICSPPPGRQTFSGGEEKLLFSCANFVDQTKSASSKCSDKDMNLLLYV